MLKSLKYLTLSLMLIGISFGSEAQEKLEILKSSFQPCVKEVRCSKLDSAQHDLETIPYFKEEIESWKEINTLKDARILEQANQIVAFSEADKIKDLRIKELEAKLSKRSRQRFSWSGGAFSLGYILGHIY